MRALRPLFGAALVAGVLCSVSPAPLQAQGNLYEHLQAFSGVLNHIRTRSLDSAGSAQLIRAAIDGMLGSLDPHSHYITRDEWDSWLSIQRGDLDQIGLALADTDGIVVVLSVARGSPADQAGVLPGDRVVAMDDTTVAGRAAGDLALRLSRTDAGPVRLRLARGPEITPDTFTVKLRRQTWSWAAVSGGQILKDGRTAYVRLYQFQESAREDLRREVRRLRGAGADRLILDVRGNPGGLVTEAVDVTGLFLGEGAPVFTVRGRNFVVRDVYRVAKAGEFRDLPLAVLVDEATASAAEVLAGSLQDNDRALIVGRRTFGKALVQEPLVVEPFGDVVWLTVGRVFIPSGRLIQRSYRGLRAEQYLGLAGHEGTAGDTAAEYRTLGGRLVRGGGGVSPDVFVRPAGVLPAWWSAAADSGLMLSIADSVGSTLGDEPSSWLADPEGWASLATALLERSRQRFGDLPPPTPDQRERIAWLLARRAASVRWPEGSLLFEAATDPDILAALSRMDRLPELLRAK